MFKLQSSKLHTLLTEEEDPNIFESTDSEEMVVYAEDLDMYDVHRHLSRKDSCEIHISKLHTPSPLIVLFI